MSYRQMFWLQGILLAAIVMGTAGHARAQGWDDDAKSKKKARASEGASAPTGFMASPELIEGSDEPDPTAEEAAPPLARQPDPRARKKPKREESDGETVPAWNEAQEKKGIVVIEENTAVPSTIRVGDEDEDRRGRPLGTGADDRSGLSLGKDSAPSAGSFTFKANAPEVREDEAEENVQEKALTKAKPSGKGAPPAKAPIGFLAPYEDDGFEETPRHNAGPDPFDEGAPVPLPASSLRPSAAREEGTAGSDAGGAFAPVKTRNFLDNGTGDMIKVDDSVDYQRDTFIEANRRGVLEQPRPEKAKPRPPPPSKPPPAPVVAAEAVPEAPARETRLLSEPVPAPAAPATPDPFSKMENDLRALDGKPPADPAGTLGPDLTRIKKAPEFRPKKFEEPEMAERPIEIVPSRDPNRDPSLIGLSLGLGGGAAVASDSTTGFTPDLAFGGQLTWNPAFAGSLALDLSYFRASRTGGTSFIRVASVWHHTAIRLLFVKEQKGGLFAGFGAGLLLTGSSVDFTLTDGAEQKADASQVRPGFDGSVVAGFRTGAFAVRLDLRTLVRGGLRLDFLPTLTLGLSL